MINNREKGEKQKRGRKMSEEGFSAFLGIVISFLSIAYGFLLLLTPERYDLFGLPPAANQLLGLLLIILGFYYYQRKRKHE